MRTFTAFMVMAVLISIGAGIASANPALMQKNIRGYPYPGTMAVDRFGAKALSDAVHQENAAEAGIVPGQTLAGHIQGKSLLPPAGDPAQLNPFAGAQQPSADMFRSSLNSGH